MMKVSSFALCIALVSAAAPWAKLRAAPPWTGFLTSQRVEADPNNSYTLSESNGPWMVLATTFSGDEAEADAKKLVQELRKKYKLPAYSYRKKFDFSGPVEARGVDRFGKPLQMRYQRDEVEEIAVLVGNFAAVDDPDAQRTLRKIKLAQPDCLKAEAGAQTSRPLVGLRAMQKALLPDPPPPAWIEKYGERRARQLWAERKNRGPMGHALVTTNPLLPPDYFAPKGIDKFVAQMNSGVKHSLLDCPGKYSVKVATFTGHAILLDRKNQEALEKGVTPKSWLEDAAKNAHTLVSELRAQGVEAYEFHDRSSSIVTVGSFQSVGTPRTDGKTEINPQVHAIMKHFGAETKIVESRVPGQVTQPQVGKAKTLAGIPFDVQPLPVEVPKRSLAADYARPGAE
jgi:hypothetical protein